jgi:rubredoxin
MDKWKCRLCGHIYDSTQGDPGKHIKPETSFEHIPDSWICPDCGAGKDSYEKLK